MVLLRRSVITRVIFTAYAIAFTFSTWGQVPVYVKKYSLQQVLKTGKPGKWREFLNTETMRAAIYEMKDRQADKIETWNEDAVYVVLKGNATLKAADEYHEVSAGSIFFLRAGLVHQYTKIKGDLIVLVIFSKAGPSDQDKAFEFYSMNDIEQKRIESENTWEPFAKFKTLTFGLYMLPEKTGGDSTLTHRVDELNYVTRGHGKFSVDNYTMDVGEGDIVFVSKGHGHYFHDLKSDFDVLIFWEQKSLAHD